MVTPDDGYRPPGGSIYIPIIQKQASPFELDDGATVVRLSAFKIRHMPRKTACLLYLRKRHWMRIFERALRTKADLRAPTIFDRGAMNRPSRRPAGYFASS